MRSVLQMVFLDTSYCGEGVLNTLQAKELETCSATPGKEKRLEISSYELDHINSFYFRNITL
jgi:hypothetical protein